jgi:hypothetical protein
LPKIAQQSRKTDRQWRFASPYPANSGVGGVISELEMWGFGETRTTPEYVDKRIRILEIIFDKSKCWWQALNEVHLLNFQVYSM